MEELQWVSKVVSGKELGGDVGWMWGGSFLLLGSSCGKMVQGGEEDENSGNVPPHGVPLLHIIKLSVIAND